jgi:hypothetical protein
LIDDLTTQCSPTKFGLCGTGSSSTATVSFESSPTTGCADVSFGSSPKTNQSNLSSAVIPNESSPSSDKSAPAATA